MKKLNIFIAGQKWFAAEVFKLILKEGHTISGVCAPLSDKTLRPLAELHGFKVITPSELTPDKVKGSDLGICAHYFGFIDANTRNAAILGFIGYHPSLLPRHRGRNSIEWAIIMRDVITGGTIYCLSDGMDQGDILEQDFCFIDPLIYGMLTKEAAAKLWRDELSPMGLMLFKKALNNLSKGIINKRVQEERFATVEP